MTDLNEPQRQAVLHESGPLLVFAGAGSGKTRVITYRIANLVAEHYVKPFRILAVTFTNKAAAEMRGRIERLVGGAITRDLWVGTFHATCAKLLRRYHAEVGLEQRFVIYDDSDQRSLLARVLKSQGVDDRTYPPKAVLGRIHRQKREGKGPGEVELSPEFDAVCQDIYAGYERALKVANAVDFEDLILHMTRIAENTTSAAGRELRGKFDHVLVDEFQDTNNIQYRLVRALAASSRNLCVVGDDDQSIYSWRGADISNIRGFRKDFPEAEVVKLEQNYRSTGNIVRSALKVIEPSRHRVPKELFTSNDAGDPIVVRGVRDERDEAAFVAQTIRMELGRGTQSDEIAIFYRINAQSRVLEEALRSERINYQVIGGMKFFERAEVKDLLGYLRLVDNPRSDADLVRVINVPARGIGNKTVDRILDSAMSRGSSAFDAIDIAIDDAGLGTAAKKKLLAFRDLIQKLREDAQTLTPHALARQILERTGYLETLRKEDTAESDARVENLNEMVGSIAEYEADAEQAGDDPSLAGYLERVALVSDVDGMKDGPTVKLMTVHSAKGLEFDAVLLTGMEEETFPYRGLEGGDSDELEEERRLAYVAVTRAKRRLYISHATMRTIFGSTRYLMPSRFIAELPKDAVDRQCADPWGNGAATNVGGAYREFGASYGSPARSSYGSAGRSGASAYRRPEGGGFGARRPGIPGSTTTAYGSSGHGSSSFDSHGRGAGFTPQQRSTLGAPQEATASSGRVVDYDAFDDIPQDEFFAPRAGSSVFHERYGRGVVEKVEAGDPPKIQARFPGFGSRKVLAGYLKFEKV